MDNSGELPCKSAAAASERQTVLAFDLYGTLLSAESIARDLGNYFDEDKSRLIAQLWRRYQLEYTWRLNSMGPFYEANVSSLHVFWAH